jgi:hypothetical protein
MVAFSSRNATHKSEDYPALRAGKVEEAISVFRKHRPEIKLVFSEVRPSNADGARLAA